MVLERTIFVGFGRSGEKSAVGSTARNRNGGGITMRIYDEYFAFTSRSGWAHHDRALPCTVIPNEMGVCN